MHITRVFCVLGPAMLNFPFIVTYNFSLNVLVHSQKFAKDLSLSIIVLLKAQFLYK